ncbi:hypothetical protein, partial [Phocaeicola sp.]|uniref:hypothetical protein n=1 Tax=Phocaeicola sp. TaxID=2773926 RepID=UPI003AF927AF
ACCGFLCLWIRNTKVSENADMAKTWATKCCSGTYKNNYQLCCGIKDIKKVFVWCKYRQTIICSYFYYVK